MARNRKIYPLKLFSIILDPALNREVHLILNNNITLSVGTGELVVDGSEDDEQEEIGDLGVLDTYK